MKCNFVKANKEVCGNNAMLKDSKCFWHSKKISEVEKNNYRSKGGKSKIIKIQSDFKEYDLNSIAEVNKLNAVLINSVLQSKLDLRIATGLTYMMSLQLRILEVSNIEKRISDIENKLLNNTNYEYSE